MPMPFMPYMPHRRPYTMFAPPCPCTPPGPPPEPHTPRPRAAPWGAVSIADALRGISSHLAELDETLAGMPKVIAVNGAPLEPVEGVVALSLVDSAELDGGYLRFKAGDAVLFSVDASPFVKDGMVDAVGVADGNLVITFNTDSGKQPVSIPLTDIFDADDYYDKAAMDNLLSGKRDRTDLSVDQDKWLLVKPDGALVWMVSRDPDDWFGDDELEPYLNRDSGPLGEAWVFEIGPQASGERTRLEVPYSEFPIDSAVIVINLEASTSFDGVYRLVRGSRLALDTEIPPAQVVDSAVTRTSANPVKSSGIWSAMWGALTVLPEGFASLYDWCVAQLAGKLAWETKHYTVGEILEAGGTGGGMWIAAKHNNTYENYLFTNGLPARPSDVMRRKDLPSNLPAARGGTATSLVTTGDKYNWNTKADAADLRYRIAEAGYATTGAKLPDNVTVMYNGAALSDSDYVVRKGNENWILYSIGGQSLGATWNEDGSFDNSSNEVSFLQDGESVEPNLLVPRALADRAVNLITATDETSIDIELPAVQAGHSRDFYLAVTCGSTAPTLNAPSGATLVNAKGEQPDLSLAPSATTVLRFTEVKESGQSTPAVFCVTGGANGGGSIDPSVLEDKRDKTDFASLGGWILTEYVGGGPGAPIWLAFTNPGWAGGDYSLEYTNSPESSFSLSQNGTQIGTVEASEDAVALEFESAIGDPIKLVRGSRLALDTEIPPTPVTPSTSPADEGKPADAKATGVALAGKADSTALAPDWDPTKAYLLGEHVSYMGKMYECILSMSAASQTNPGSDTTHWKLTDLAAPDATLDIMSDGRLRVVAADGQVLWTQGYALASGSAVTLSCEKINKYVFAATTATAFSNSATYAVGDRVTYGGKVYKCSTAVETAGAWTGATNWDEDPDTQAFALPSAPPGIVGDFVLDVDNTANEVQVMVAISGTLGTDYDLIVEKGRSSVDILTIEGGALAELYFTMTAFGTAAKPAWRVVRLDVERQGVGS